MKTEKIIHQHRMTLFNHDLIAEWYVQNNDEIRITTVNFIHPEQQNFLSFMSGKVLTLIVDDIEAAELIRKWM